MKKHFLVMALLSVLAAAAVLVAVFVLLKLWPSSVVTVQSGNPAANVNAYVNSPVYFDLGAKAEFVKITSPRPGDKLKSPLTITGEARLWYFEASFPVELKDANGAVIASAPAQAQGDWMTEDFVPFKVTLEFSAPTTRTGTLTLRKDNPSGLPQNDDSVTVPVEFAAVAAAAGSAACKPTGCSSQICSDQDMVTTCEFLPEYGCYQKAKCERQADGKCGWAQTADLILCLDKARQ